MVFIHVHNSFQVRNPIHPAGRTDGMDHQIHPWFNAVDFAAERKLGRTNSIMQQLHLSPEATWRFLNLGPMDFVFWSDDLWYLCQCCGLSWRKNGSWESFCQIQVHMLICLINCWKTLAQTLSRIHRSGSLSCLHHHPPPNSTVTCHSTCH